MLAGRKVPRISIGHLVGIGDILHPDRPATPNSCRVRSRVIVGLRMNPMQRDGIQGEKRAGSAPLAARPLPLFTMHSPRNIVSAIECKDALVALARTLGMFEDKLKISGRITLEELVAGSMKGRPRDGHARGGRADAATSA